MPDSPACYPMERATYCAECGYDLRGLPVHTRCPECGRRSEAGLPAEHILRWAERLLVDLHGIAVLGTVATLAAAGGWILGEFGRGLVACPGLTFVGLTNFLYGITLARYAKRRATPNFRNLPDRLRERLREWLILDLLLVALPLAAVAIWLATSS